MAKYIDAEKLKAEIKHLKIDVYDEAHQFDLGARSSLTFLESFIDSLQQEQPMPDSTKLIELWHEDKEMLKEKDFRNDPWRLAYNAFLCGFGRGIAVNKQEQPEVECEDLEEAAEESWIYYEYRDSGHLYSSVYKDAFKAGAEWQSKKDQDTIKTAEDHAFLAGANWQKEQFEKNRLAACDNQTREEYDREMDFSTSIIEKEHRHPTFSDAINYGIKLQKEQMVKEGLKGEVCGRVRDHINIRFPDGLCKYLEPKNISHIPADVTKYNVGDKVCVIIVKEE